MGSGRLEGKRAIVVGAGSVASGWGNGRAIAVRFVEEGARVLAVDRSLDSMQETLDKMGDLQRNATTFICDATNSNEVASMVDHFVDFFGGIDILVNVVGGSSPGGPVDLSEDAWDAQLDLNLKSVFLTCKYVLPVMVGEHSGSIVNLASTSGLRWSGSAQIGYAAAKAGVIQFSKVAAVQYAPHGIRINTVIPGQLHTPMVEARLAQQRSGGDVETLLAQRKARIPLEYVGDGRDTANAALFLASDEARFITGAEIVVDGGMTVRCD